MNNQLLNLWNELKSNYDEDKLSKLIEIFKEDYSESLESYHNNFSEEFCNIKVGDIVIEYMCAGINKNKLNTIGQLVKITLGDNIFTDTYTIKLLDGSLMDWNNCKFYKVIKREHLNGE